MDIEELMRIVSASDLARHRDYLRGVVRPAIDILRTNAAPTLAGSRFGGSPDLPPGTPWPTHQWGPYWFFAQINFAEIPTCDLGLPANGLLSLFYVENPELVHFYDDHNYVIAQFIPTGTEVIPAAVPESVKHRGVASIAFRPMIDIPFDEYQRDDWPFFDDEAHAYCELRKSLHESEDYLLG